MIMTLANAMAGSWSVDGRGRGLALRLVDPLAGRLVVLVLRRREVRLGVDVLGVLGGRGVTPDLHGLDRPRHEVAKDVLGDLEAALQLRDGLGRGFEDHDVVRAIAVAVDGIREAAAAPGCDL